MFFLLEVEFGLKNSYNLSRSSMQLRRLKHYFPQSFLLVSVGYLAKYFIINRSPFIYSLNQQTIILHLLLCWVFKGGNYTLDIIPVLRSLQSISGGSAWRLFNVKVFWTVEKFNIIYNTVSLSFSRMQLK